MGKVGNAHVMKAKEFGFHPQVTEIPGSGRDSILPASLTYTHPLLLSLFLNAHGSPTHHSHSALST